MTQAQIELQNALTTNFLANLVFLSEYDNELYHRVDELSRMIETGTYKEKYALEFIMESGDFDIYDIVNDKYLYDKKPKKVNDKLNNEIHLDEKNSIFGLPEYFLTKNKIEINKDNRFNYQSRNEFVLLTQHDMSEYSNTFKDYLDSKNKKLKRINKFIFFGTFLGRHISKIANKIKADMYLILERNLEIFRLSLFTTDYTVLLAEKGLFFSIMEDDLTEENKILTFLTIHQWNNYLIKISSTGLNINKYVDKTLSSILSLNSMSYDYNRKLYSYINRTTKVLKSSYKTLLFKQIKKESNFFNDLPILYLAAGPSLDENISWIKENQNRFFIVTIGAVYSKIILNEIKVDMIITLDEDEAIVDLQFSDSKINEIDENTIILASTITNEIILQRLLNKNLFLFEIFYSFHKNSYAFDGFSVGEIALDIILSFNAKEIYIVGLDLALNQDTGAYHSNNSQSSTLNLDLDAKQRRDIFSDTKSLINIKGNFKEKVYTTSFFYSSIKNLEQKLEKKPLDTKIFNLSSHGAYFEGTQPTKIENIDLEQIEKKYVNNKELIDFLNINSLNHLEKESQNDIQNIVNFLDNDLKSLLDKIKNVNCKTYEELYKELILIPEKIYYQSFFSIYEIISNYFDMVIPYLSYHFNDIKVKNESKKVEKIKNIFLRQISELIEDYKDCLERLIK